MEQNLSSKCLSIPCVLRLYLAKRAPLSKWAADPCGKSCSAAKHCLFSFYSSSSHLSLLLLSLPSPHPPHTSPPSAHLSTFSGCVICRNSVRSNPNASPEPSLAMNSSVHQNIIHSCSTKMKRGDGRRTRWGRGHPVVQWAKANNMYHVCLDLAFDPCRTIPSLFHLF